MSKNLYKKKTLNFQCTTTNQEWTVDIQQVKET